MDERIFTAKPGSLIPSWDLMHRLSIDKSAGPEVKDSATIFRINSTYMDVTDQPYLERQWNCAAVLVGFWGIILSAFAIYLFNFSVPNKDPGLLGLIVALVFGVSMTIFGHLTFKLGRDEYFSLTRRTIRFNRKEKKIYFIRRRRFFSKKNEGDITWTIPWNNESIFCAHKGKTSNGDSYHIRAYILDNDGKILKAFALGRNWEGARNIETLLAQWNYWQLYMNKGPGDLPSPALFLSEKENLLETFLICMYDFGYNTGPALRVIFMPLILMMTFFRLVALSTCRDPKWPEYVERVSSIDANDPCDQPKGDTPIGWARTAIARENNSYPSDPRRKSDDWRGENDGSINAMKWASDRPHL